MAGFEVTLHGRFWVTPEDAYLLAKLEVLPELRRIHGCLRPAHKITFLLNRPWFPSIMSVVLSVGLVCFFGRFAERFNRTVSTEVT